MKIKNLFITFLTIFSLVFLFAACEKDGPAEKAGENIDEAMEETGNTLEDAADEMDPDGPVEEAGENLDEAAEEISD